MTTKIKMTINRTPAGNINKINSDVVVQDCNIQLSQQQYESILSVRDYLSRCWISMKFLNKRPKMKMGKKEWWIYAYEAVLEQRVRPYTWSKIKTTREHYRQYMETYKKTLLNPNDTELKLDLQKYEDCLSIVNIVIARKHTGLMVSYYYRSGNFA